MDNNERSSEDNLKDSINTAQKVQSAIKTGKSASQMAKGIAMGSPHAMALLTILQNKETIFRIMVVVVLILLFPILLMIMLPAIFWNGDAFVDDIGFYNTYYEVESSIRDILTESYDFKISIVQEIIDNLGEDEIGEIHHLNISFDTALLISQYCVYRDNDLDTINLDDLQNLIRTHKENLFDYKIETKKEIVPKIIYGEDGEETEIEIEVTKIIYQMEYVGDDYFASNVFFLSEEQRKYANQLAENMMLFMNGEGFSGVVGTSNVSSDVERHDAIFRKYAEMYGIPEFIELIKAVAMQESGGRHVDIMQSAESAYNTRYPQEPNGIKDTEYSIDCGVHYLAKALSMAGCNSPTDLNKLSLALQGYNFGTGYIPWALRNYGGYSEANAIEFSNIQKAKLGWKRYGDTKYVEHVMRYYNPFTGDNGEWGSPFVGRDWKKAVTSEFGYRKDPITEKQGAYHDGLDIAYPKGTHINAIRGGKVIRSINNGNGFGFHIIIEHSDGSTALYGHCSKLDVRVGDMVMVGQKIAEVGTTGRSTGNHLHLTITINGQKVNARNFIG